MLGANVEFVHLLQIDPIEKAFGSKKKFAPLRGSLYEKSLHRVQP